MAASGALNSAGGLELRTPAARLSGHTPEMFRSMSIANEDKPGADTDGPGGQGVGLIPVVEETLRVGKREIETDRVILRKTVSVHDETVDVLLRTQDISVERVPVGRMVTEAPRTREEGEWLIVPILEEVLVVEKRLVLKEELRIRRQESRHSAQQTVQLRREQVAVEHAAPGAGIGPEANTKEDR